MGIVRDGEWLQTLRILTSRCKHWGCHAIRQDHLKPTKVILIFGILQVLQVFDLDFYVFLQHLQQFLGCWKLEIHWFVIIPSIALRVAHSCNCRFKDQDLLFKFDWLNNRLIFCFWKAQYFRQFFYFRRLLQNLLTKFLSILDPSLSQIVFRLN